MTRSRPRSAARRCVPTRPVAPRSSHRMSFPFLISHLYSRLVIGAGRAAVPVRSLPLLPLLLFAASAAFTVWRNTQVAVLVDIPYILNIATGIAAGDVPYAQFPLAQAPLTFLVQALLIKVFGPHFFVQIAYAATAGGLATVLTYLIARRLVVGVVARPATLAAVLAIPLLPLGIYAILPNPFYDPDGCLAILAAVAAIFAASDRPTRMRWLVAGAVVSLPGLLKPKKRRGGVIPPVAPPPASTASPPPA